MGNRIVIYYGEELYHCDDELYHHGILGQKWGKRNGPPYPLDPEDHSAGEKKAGWKNSLSGPKVKRSSDNKGSSSFSIGNKKKRQPVQKTESKKNEKKDEHKGLTDKQKKMIAVGAAAVVAGLAVYGVYRYSNVVKEMNATNSLIREGQKAVEAVYNHEGFYKDALSSVKSANYLGNDLKYHTASKVITSAGSSFKNYDVSTQKTFDSVKEFMRAKRRLRLG